MKTITTILILLVTTSLFSQKVIVDEENETITISSKRIIKELSFRVSKKDEGKNYEGSERFEVNKKIFKIRLDKLKDGVNEVLIDYGVSIVLVYFYRHLYMASSVLNNKTL